GNYDKALTTVEKNWLEGNDSITVGTLKDFRPYSHYHDENGEYFGFIYNAFTQFMDTLDVDLNISFNHYEDYDQLLKALDSGEVDAIFPVPAYLYQSEQNNYVYTKVIASESMTLVYKDSYTEGSLATVAYPATGIAKYFDDEYYTTSKLLEYASYEECLKAVYDEAVTCTILRNRMAEEAIEDNKELKKLNRITLPQKL
ncbi:MAG: transporter substrate-binding domain-containing protein, partial [Lachnospiraceae bacterium]|nr:transporter substrate-binding domain-containing protein [Lachnospiraceae bacterium]